VTITINYRWTTFSGSDTFLTGPSPNRWPATPALRQRDFSQYPKEGILGVLHRTRSDQTIPYMRI